MTCTHEAASVLRCDFAEGDEVQSGEFAQKWKGLAFDIARGAEPGPNARQIGVIVTRVRDELPGAGGDPIEKTVERHGVECTRAGYAERATGGREAFFGKDAMPAGLKAAKNADLRGADESSAGRGMNSPCGLKWIAN